MTRLALAGKCGALGASGLGAASGAAFVGDAKTLRVPPARSDARATLPTPTPHSAKKCRRVISRSSAALRAGRWLQGIVNSSIGGLPLPRTRGRGRGRGARGVRPRPTVRLADVREFSIARFTDVQHRSPLSPALSPAYREEGGRVHH